MKTLLKILERIMILLIIIIAKNTNKINELQGVIRMKLYIGVDLGTSAVKLLLMEENGANSLYMTFGLMKWIDEYDDTYKGIKWQWIQNYKAGKVQALKFKTIIYKTKDLGGVNRVGQAKIDFLESRYKEPQKIKSYNFTRFASGVSQKSHEHDDGSSKPKFDLKNINFNSNPNNPNDMDPIQTNTSDLNYSFDNENAITSFNSNNNNNNDNK